MKIKYLYLLFFISFSFSFAKNNVAAVPSGYILSGISMPKDSLITLEEAQKRELSLAQNETTQLLQQARFTANLGFISLLVILVGAITFNTGVVLVLGILLGIISSIFSIKKLVKVQQYFKKYKDLSLENELKDKFRSAIIRTVFASMFSGLWVFLFALTIIFWGEEIDIDNIFTPRFVSTIGFFMFLLFDHKQFKTAKKMNTKNS